MHHCTKFGENRSRIFLCNCFSNSENAYFLDKEGGRIFGNMTEALAHPTQKKERKKKNEKKKNGKNVGRRIQYRLSSDLHVYLMF